MWLESIARVVNQIGGYFTFKIGDEEYVVMKKSDLDGQHEGRQLELGAIDQSRGEDEAPVPAEQFSMPSGEEEPMDNLQPEHIPLDQDAIEEGSTYSPQMEPVNNDEPSNISEDNIEWPVEGDSQNKVKFEPLKGDLPPELQE